MTLIELHSILQTVEAGKKKSHSNSVASAHVMDIHQGKWKKRKNYSQPKWKWNAHIGESSDGLKGKVNFDDPHAGDLKKVVCFPYGHKRH